MTTYDPHMEEQARKRWNSLAKPLYGLGGLEDAVSQMAALYNRVTFPFPKKALLVMCADNGIVKEGVTQTGQEVTAVVARNFLSGKTSACHMARRAGVDVYPVDIGIASDVPGLTDPSMKVSYGTGNFLDGPAMTREQVIRAMDVGRRMAAHLSGQGYGLLAVGEMGIGNTTTSAACAAALLSLSPETVTGRGAGLSDVALVKKTQVIREGLSRLSPDPSDPIDVLSKVGGLDICGLTGAILEAKEQGMTVVLDGAITACAALCAFRLDPDCRRVMLASHLSREPVSRHILKELALTPCLDCGLRLGEGTGALLMIPLLEMAHSVYMDMPTFSDIQIADYEDYRPTQAKSLQAGKGNSRAGKGAEA